MLRNLFVFVKLKIFTLILKLNIFSLLKNVDSCFQGLRKSLCSLLVKISSDLGIEGKITTSLNPPFGIIYRIDPKTMVRWENARAAGVDTSAERVSATLVEWWGAWDLRREMKSFRNTWAKGSSVLIINKYRSPKAFLVTS